MDRDELTQNLSDLETELLDHEDHVLEEVDGFYSDLKDYLKRILEHFESDFEESCEIPEVNVFAPIDSINSNSSNISEAELLIGMSDSSPTRESSETTSLRKNILQSGRISEEISLPTAR